MEGWDPPFIGLAGTRMTPIGQIRYWLASVLLIGERPRASAWSLSDCERGTLCTLLEGGSPTPPAGLEPKSRFPSPLTEDLRQPLRQGPTRNPASS